MKELERAGVALAAIASLAMLAISIAPSAAVTLSSPARILSAASAESNIADYQNHGDPRLCPYIQSHLHHRCQG